MLTFNSRAKGLAAFNLFVNSANFLNTYLPPLAIIDVGYRFCLFYVCWDAVGICVIYLTFVETKGRNLEEMEEIFNDPHPVKASLAMQKVVF